jgi:hypothetical protein
MPGRLQRSKLCDAQRLRFIGSEVVVGAGSELWDRLERPADRPIGGLKEALTVLAALSRAREAGAEMAASPGRAAAMVPAPVERSQLRGHRQRRQIPQRRQ